MSFGERLREERELAGMSGRGLARAAGLRHHSQQLYESGEIEPVRDGAARLADALGLDPFDLRCDGPRLFEVEFGGPVALTAGTARISEWPDMGDGRSRFRVRASALPTVVALAGPDVPPPTVRPLAASASLMVMVRARHSQAAHSQVLREAGRAECCPPVSVVRRGALWVARLTNVPERCSMIMQRLASDAPIGLFVPTV